MSFNFGNTSTPAKPTFGTSFSFGGGQTAAPAFGTPATSAPAFGQTNTAPSFGGFGATPATSAPTFSGFGQTQTAAVSAFGQTSTAAPAFGQTPSATPSFGQPATAAPTFGQATTPAPLFGQASTAAAPTFGGFGGTATTSAPSFNFGGTSTAPTFSGFGAPATSSSLFGGGFGTTSTSTSAGFGGFGSTFGSSFGKPAQPLSFGGFGASTGFGQPQQQQQQQIQPFGQLQQQQQQQQQPTLSPEQVFMQSIYNVSIFGDERDTTIARWNYLQAQWGSGGKAFYSQNNAPVDIEPQNPLCRFKTMGYSRLPGKENKVGLVALKFGKTSAQIKDQQQQIINTLNQVFGNRPNLIVNVDSIHALSDTKGQMIIFVEEKSQTSNETKRYNATETAQFLSQPMSKPQLGNVGVEEVLPLVLPDEDQLKEYLESPPKGIDPRMWKQAIDDNPEPTKFIPVPMIGFQDLKWRITCQENETNTHLNYLAKVEKEISELKQRHVNTSAKIMEHRRKFAELSHRILKIIVKQESTRKMGVSLSPEEEIIKTKLENMHALVSAPTQFKGRLSELLSQMRMQRNQWGSAGPNEYTLDKESSEEMKSFLTMQQKAMSMLIETVNQDLKDLKIIYEGMSRLVA